MELMIKEFILNNYDVFDVEYTTTKVHLGSGPNEKGETSINRKIINVYIENIKQKKNVYLNSKTILKIDRDNI